MHELGLVTHIVRRIEDISIEEQLTKSVLCYAGAWGSQRCDS